jgi:biopolymer transport protein ExbD
MPAGRRGLQSDNPWARRRVTAGELDLTPMIDVTFQLLIFFMVSSTLQSIPDIDLPVAAHSIGVETDGAAVLTLFAGGPQSPPRIVLGDGVGEEATIEEIRAYVAEAVAAGRTKIVVKAEGDITHGFVGEVARAIVAVEGAELYMGVGDQPTR